ncbi:FadR family transcriptional regulator [Streptomyces luteolifulvus]|jgi:GntR family transcriptional repressor for pyruvate dehydrogenase complex|uniref:FadR family transcriptional regulator n=1 Tax=Streptomyces luteolifulvus TaxID=2615112 RepID=A0A6H9UWT6_9ACTN|nr:MULTISPECIES: FadR/GntR family transcriptional regulator [Streptomyces]KAB1142905.1 FadR family transcriptional regulator [Streptomyces luteolifulvus]MXM68840.1 FCD domain-containing protein [Streptomyces sp. HUCO-GS316]
MAEATAAWEPVPRSRTFELVLARIEEQILAGNLRVGDKLPPERELVELLGVSRAAVREALRVLEAHGVLRSRVGTGSNSGSVIAAMPSHGLTQLLRLHMALANFPLGDVVEVRATLERSSARLAAERATEDDLARMREDLACMDAAGVAREEFNDCDTDFHVAIAEAGGNRMIADMTIAVRNAVRHTLLSAFHSLPDWEPVAARLRAEHHAIYDAIVEGDAERAGDLVESHIRGFHQDVVRTALQAADPGRS